MTQPNGDANGTIVPTTNELTESKTVTKRLDASRMIIRPLLPGDERPVPGPLDPVRRTQSCTTSHMLTVNWSKETGWGTPEIKPYTNFSLSPIASVLHYGTECFEGLKAYRGTDGKLRLFRPERNCQRMRLSALRGGLPDFDPLELSRLIAALVATDGKRWLPEPGTFLYIRPALIGTNSALGVSKPSEATLFIVAVLFPQFGQAGPGLKLLCSQGQVRAWPGGFGNAKLGANYAPSLEIQQQANAQGFIQVLWLFGSDDWVTEAGASNFFVIVRNKNTGRPELITPPLGDIILDGVTRRSVLELAREKLTGGLGVADGLEAIEVSERQLPMSELVAASNDGRLMEGFVTGTAFFVAPVQMIRYQELDLRIGGHDEGGRLLAPYCMLIREYMTKIMYGEDQHPWACVVEEQ